MKPNRMRVRQRVPGILGTTLLFLGVHAAGWAADTDIYRGSSSSGAPNVLFFLDNTANWSNKSQAWTPGSSWDKCKSLDDDARQACMAAIEEVFYVGKPDSEARPWQAGFNDWTSNQSPTQGQVELRALRFVLEELVCSGGDEALNVNVGLSMFSADKGSVKSSGHAVGFVYHAVQPLDVASGTCAALLTKLNNIDAKIQDPTTKAPQDANYGAALYEVFKYFGGYTNPDLTGATSVAGSPEGRAGYGPLRYSNKTSLDDPDAFVAGSNGMEYKSPLGESGVCGNNYVVLVGNTYPKSEPKSTPTQFHGINYTPPALSPVTSDTSLYADEWSYFLANTDVHEAAGIQRVYTYGVNVYNDKPDTDQRRLLKSMAAVGGVGSSGYVEVGGDLLGLINAFKSILYEIASVNSVFTASTLPVSTTTQGTYLNQVFIGMFRPDAQGNPRWVGNLKQYELGFVNGVLDMVDAKGHGAIMAGTGFFDPAAESYWTADSVFFAQAPSGTPPSASDLPDGPIVEKGGAAQMLRKNNLQSAANRKVYTLPEAPAAGAPLSSTPFDNTNAAVTDSFSDAEISWVRGEANVTEGSGAENLVGSYKDGDDIELLDTQGARHSIHGDVLHSRPVALNYGGGNVVVYYGSNDGFLRAVDGRKTGNTAGHELWSFVAPEHYDMLGRLRDGSPTLHLPETDSAGGTIAAPDGMAPKSYGMDGPIGVYARYAGDGGSVSEAVIYAAMRRGGRAVYALDVSDPSTPTFKWKISGDDGGAYAKLAQTWSMPRPVVLKSDGATPPVLLLMGGGYDPAEDKNSISNPQVGNVVYVINGRTGGQIAALSTEFSVPSDVAVADVDYDGQVDRAYVADVRGNLYRIDFPAEGDLTQAATWQETEAVRIATLDGKVFFPPDVVATKDFVSVMVGTGDREKPLLVSTTDNFFMIKDTLGAPRNEPVTKDHLTRIARIDNSTMQPVDLAPSPVVDAEGCYIQLATNGEKVVNGAFTIAGMTYFSTNRPAPADANSCTGDLGEAYAYNFPLFCVAPPTPTPLIGGGLPPSPVGGIVEIMIDGVPTKVPFIIGSGQGGSPFKPGNPKPPVDPVRTRLNWRIDNSNR